MNDFKNAKLKMFMNDKAMAEAVFDVLLESFLKRKSGEDTDMKAARFIATELLQEGWAELNKYKTDGGEDNKPSGNVGL